MGLDKLAVNADKPSPFERWQVPLIVLTFSALLLLGGDVARDWLRFERTGITTGEAWRLLSGHFVHIGPSHFALNMAGLGLVWYLVGDALDRRQWALVLIFGIATIDLGFWLLNPELQWYVGLSGVLHTLLVTGLIACGGKERKELIAIAILVAVKIVWEQAAGPLPGSVQSSGGAVIVDAHLYGAAAGIPAGILARIRVRRAASI